MSEQKFSLNLTHLTSFLYSVNSQSIALWCLLPWKETLPFPQRGQQRVPRGICGLLPYHRLKISLKRRHNCFAEILRPLIKVPNVAYPVPKSWHWGLALNEILDFPGRRALDAIIGEIGWWHQKVLIRILSQQLNSGQIFETVLKIRYTIQTLSTKYLIYMFVGFQSQRQTLNELQGK